jgi:hypothetical protein
MQLPRSSAGVTPWQIHGRYMMATTIYIREYFTAFVSISATIYTYSVY